MSQREKTIQECVDALCEQGCSKVNDYIGALQNGEDFPEVAGMSRAERQDVLRQLIEIMAVYDGSCES